MDWLEDDWIDWQTVVKHTCEESELVDEIDCLKGNEHSREELSRFMRCIYGAVKAEYEKDAILFKHSEIFNRLYRDSIPKVTGFYLSEQSWEWILGRQTEGPDYLEPQRKVYSDEGVIFCLALLTELSIVMLHSLDGNGNAERVADTIWVVRTLASALDKRTLFQRHHADRDLPSFIQYNPHTFTKFFERSTFSLQDCGIEEIICGKTASMTSKLVLDEIYYKPCKCRICEPPESYRWITILLEYFGNNLISDINGFEELVTVLNSVKEPEKLKLEVVEVVLHFVSMALEFLKDEIASGFFDPCVEILRFISTGSYGEYTVHSLGAISMIFKHLRAIFKYFLQPQVAECMVEEVEKRMQEQLLASFSATVGPPPRSGFDGPRLRSERSSANLEAPRQSSFYLRRSSFARLSENIEPRRQLSSHVRRSSLERRLSETV